MYRNERHSPSRGQDDDDIDVEALLDAALEKKVPVVEEKRSERSSSRKRSKSPSATTTTRKHRRNSRSRSRRRRTRSPNDRRRLSPYRRTQSPRRYRRSPPSRYRTAADPRRGRRSRSNDGRSVGLRSNRRNYESRERSKPKDKSPELSTEQRDIRTVFCMQLAARIRPRDLERFFEQAGKVRDVRLITDPRTKKSKGVAYVEFREVESVASAIAMSGQTLLGVPIIVKPSNAEKNRQANVLLPMLNAAARGDHRDRALSSLLAAATTGSAGSASGTGPVKLYVGSLHFHINEDMLRGLFEPFGPIESINLMRDPETNRSRGFAFVTYGRGDDAKRAIEQLNAFELAGRPIKVAHVNDRGVGAPDDLGLLDSEETDQHGIPLGATGRLALMAKLADGSGLQMPKEAINALNYSAAVTTSVPGTRYTMSSSVGSECFILGNMFDPTSSTLTEEAIRDIRDGVISECNKQGGLCHLYVDTKTGHVYVKCPSLSVAKACVTSLHGRYYGGRLIQANYLPLSNYHQLFPESLGMKPTTVSR